VRRHPGRPVSGGVLDQARHRVQPQAQGNPSGSSSSWRQLGAPRCPPVERACEWLFVDNQQPDGRFVASKNPRDDVICLNGNLLWSLVTLGYATDPRTLRAATWLVAPACATLALPAGTTIACPGAWGAPKVLKRVARPAGGLSPGRDAERHRQRRRIPARPDACSPATGLRAGAERTLGATGVSLSYHSDAVRRPRCSPRRGSPGHPRVQEVREWLLGRQTDEGQWPADRLVGNGWSTLGAEGRPRPGHLISGAARG